jgi:hypothetical protein
MGTRTIKNPKAKHLRTTTDASQAETFSAGSLDSFLTPDQREAFRRLAMFVMDEHPECYAIACNYLEKCGDLQVVLLRRDCDPIEVGCVTPGVDPPCENCDTLEKIVFSNLEHVTFFWPRGVPDEETRAMFWEKIFCSKLYGPIEDAWMHQ